MSAILIGGFNAIETMEKMQADNQEENLLDTLLKATCQIVDRVVPLLKPFIPSSVISECKISKWGSIIQEMNSCIQDLKVFKTLMVVQIVFLVSMMISSGLFTYGVAKQNTDLVRQWFVVVPLGLVVLIGTMVWNWIVFNNNIEIIPIDDLSKALYSLLTASMVEQLMASVIVLAMVVYAIKILWSLPEKSKLFAWLANKM